MSGIGIPSVALLLAAIPTILWYALRLQDGDAELVGLVPLVAAVWFAFRDRKTLRVTPPGAWTSVALLLLQAAAFPILPAMIRALLMVAAFASFSGIWLKPGILFLLILALPWSASLDFFLGYPLRTFTSINAAFLLETLGLDVTRSGVRLLYEGRMVGVDPACSGMNMLWSAALLTAMLAAVLPLGWRRLFPLGIAALALAIVGNSVRAALLFFPEADLVEMPHLLHPGIGLAVAGGCFLILVKIARGLSRKGARTSLVGSPAADGGIAMRLLIPASSLVLLASLFSTGESAEAINAPQTLTTYQGAPVVRVPLSEEEENFYGNFPGSIAVYEGEGFKLIVRQVDRATRKLHPASHCLRAEGFRIGDRMSVHDGRSLSYTATRGGLAIEVKERVESVRTNRSWPEISAWFWHALSHPGSGPWEAVTLIRQQTL